MATLSSGTQILGNAALHAGNYANVVNRGHPASSSTLTLETIDGAHMYQATNVSSLRMPTVMVENSVYQVQYGTTSSGQNIDIILYPNFTTYSGQFDMDYWASYPGVSANWIKFSQNRNDIYFDHQNGGAGQNPKGQWTIFNCRNRKSVIYHGGDDESVVFGTARWNNSTTQWSTVGELAGLNSSAKVWAMVKRIG